MSARIEEHIEARFSAAAGIIGQVRDKGVQLWSKQGVLHYRGPKGALTREDMQQLHESKDLIVALLEQSSGISAQAPLTHSQRAHWNASCLYERPSVRQLACAMRLHGPLDVGALREALQYVVHRHQALRTRVVMSQGVPTQVVDASAHIDFATVDICTLTVSDRESEMLRLIDAAVLGPVDPAVGPMLAITLARWAHDEHVLIVAMEHLISDAHSMSIFLRDLFVSYGAYRSKRPVELPPLPIQFAEFAQVQSRSHHAWALKHGEYWRQHLAGCGRVSFPRGNQVAEGGASGWGTTPICIGRALKAELRHWCRAHRSTLPLVVFTIYAALVLRWCKVSDMVLRYQTDGRATPQVHNTIGYFASILNLRVTLMEGDRLLDLLQRITREYCQAYEHNDFSYLDAQVPRPPFANNPAFNWVPQALSNESSGAARGDEIEMTPMAFDNPVLRQYQRESDPMLLLYDHESEIVGGVHYSRGRFSAEFMDRFASNFFVVLKTLLAEPQAAVAEIQLR
jgi:hypothetical protein